MEPKHERNIVTVTPERSDPEALAEVRRRVGDEDLLNRAIEEVNRQAREQEILRAQERELGSVSWELQENLGTGVTY